MLHGGGRYILYRTQRHSIWVMSRGYLDSCFVNLREKRGCDRNAEAAGCEAAGQEAREQLGQDNRRTNSCRGEWRGLIGEWATDDVIIILAPICHGMAVFIIRVARGRAFVHRTVENCGMWSGGSPAPRPESPQDLR